MIPTSSKEKEVDELLYAVWSLVMVRNQLANASGQARYFRRIELSLLVVSLFLNFSPCSHVRSSGPVGKLFRNANTKIARHGSFIRNKRFDDRKRQQ